MFYDTLLALCDQNNTTVTTVIKELNMSTSKGTAWKNGTIPNGKILTLLANYFGVSVDYLLGNDAVNINGEPLTELQKEVLCELKNVSAEDTEKIKDYIRLIKKASKDE